MQRGEGRTLAAVLFTDMVDSTAIAEELGDRRWKALVDAHHRIVRRELKRFGGTELDTAGDGFFASFKEPASAIGCACAASEAVRELGVEIRAGVHFGECERIGKKLGGITVVIGARIMSLGGAGEVLVSGTAADLSRGAGFGFEDRGMRTLKGVDGEWRVFAATTVDGTARPTPLEPEEARARRQALGTVPTRGHRATVLVAGIVALTLVAAAIVVPRLRGPGDTTIPPDSVGVFDRASGRLLATVPVGNRPSAVAVGEDAIWVANAGNNNVTRIDPSSRRAINTIPVGSSPQALAVSTGAVWVANADGRSISHIDPTTNTVVEEIQVGGGPLAITASSTGIWVANSLDGTVQRIDPETGAAGEPIPVGGSPAAIAADASGVWVANRDDGTITVIDESSQKAVPRARVGTDPNDIATTDAGIWVTNGADGTVSIIPEEADRGPTAAAVGGDPTAVAATGDDRWVASGSEAALRQLTPDGVVVRTIDVGAAPSDLAVTGDEVWVTAVAIAGGAHRGGTLRLLMTGDHVDLDPAVAYDASSWALLAITNDGLVGYRKTGGPAGATLVPDLATSLASPTDGGRTYRFQVRQSITYSDGTSLVPTDFRRAIERAFASGLGGFYSAIVGAPACIESPTDCDLSDGIEADDTVGTIAFHLSKPDPEFLYKLALPFAFAVPTTTPDPSLPEDRALTTPLPATGPYRVASYSPNDHITLERNEAFRQWSSAAQPDGFPDRIEVQLGVAPNDLVTRIEDGAADGTFPEDSSPIPHERVHQLVTTFTAQTHITLDRTVAFFALNTHVPPFDDPRVRRALNYAIDRDQIVDVFGGKTLARLSCQVLPPNVPGYSPSCPYTLDPSPAGAWTAPDLRTANRLVDASGTRGMSVTVSTFNGFADQRGGAARHLVGVLRDLGYRATLLDFGGDFEAHFRTFSDSSNRIGAGIWYWVPDYLAPSSYIVDLLSCDSYVPNDPYNNNIAGFCDRELDAEMGRARKLLAEDPSAGAELWAEIDRRIMAAAPWIPLIVSQRVDVVSARVGNYQRHPQWGTLVDQMWVVE